MLDGTQRHFLKTTDAVVEGFADGKKTVGIAEGAFADCVELMSVKLPVSVTEIGARAFSGCLALKTVVCDNPILGGACFVVSVGEYAFSGCGSLESVPAFAADKLVSFGQYAFSGCGSLRRCHFRQTGAAGKSTLTDRHSLGWNGK